MRKFFSIAALLALALPLAIPASADPIATGDTVTISDPGGRFGSGGPFLVTANSQTWVTFCLETNETLSFGPTYYVRLNTGATRGGAAGQTSPDFDPLSNLSAYAYYLFRTGNPFGWTGAQVQEFIWYQENEINSINPLNPLLSLALNGWSNNGRVVVLNLFDSYDPQRGFRGYRQDLLALRPVPEPASLLLLGAGLIGLAGVLRRRRAH